MTDVYRSAERNRVLEALQDGPKQARELMLDAELRNRNATDILLHKMVRDGEIVRAERGLYALPGKEGKRSGKDRKDGKIGQ
jgi:Transcriptional regulator, AbiEi antitoxin